MLKTTGLNPLFSGGAVHLQSGDSDKKATTENRCHSSGAGTSSGASRLNPRSTRCLEVLPLLFAPTMSMAADLDYFRLTGLGGSLELGYSVEDLEVKRLDGTTKTQRRPVSEQKLRLDTEGYVFHPNLLEMALGVGVRFRDEEYETDSGSTQSKETLYSFNGEFDILKEKPYPLHLYYNQYNPTVSTGLGDKVTTENKNYGLLLALKEPFMPFPIWMRADHAESKGEGGGTSVDSEYDFQELRMSTGNMENISAQVSIDHSRKQSGSGSLNLPLQSTLNEKTGFNYHSTISFGDNKRNTFVNLLTYDIDEFKDISKTKSGRFYASLELDHEGDLESFYRYNIENTTDTSSDIESTYETLSFGVLGDLTENLTFSGDLNASDEQNQGFDRNSYGAQSVVRYKMELSEQAAFTTSYSFNYTRNKQVSELLQTTRTGETHLLENLQPVVLANEFVVPGSIVVYNQDRTQTYVEGMDYILTVVGGETRLERLLSGNIADGETVLIDYAYETGGTFDVGLLNQSLTAGLALLKTYNFRVGYFKQEETLEDGRPLRPLYTRERTSASAEARHRINPTMAFGWHLELEKQTGNLKPFERREADINYTTALPFLSSFASFQSRYEYIDNKLSEEDVDLTRHSLRLFARTGIRSRASLNYSVEKDTGGTIPREVRRGGLKYDWKWRLLSFSLEGKYSLEEQGDASRKDSSVYLTLIRKL